MSDVTYSLSEVPAYPGQDAITQLNGTTPLYNHGIVDPEMVTEINSITSKRYALLLSAKDHARTAANRVQAAGAKTRHKVAAAAHSEMVAKISTETKTVIAWATALLNHPIAAGIVNWVGKGNLITFLATNKTVVRLVGWAARKAHSVLTTVSSFVGDAMIASEIKPLVKMAEVVNDAHAVLERNVVKIVQNEWTNALRCFVHGVAAFAMVTSVIDHLLTPEQQAIIGLVYLLWNSPKARYVASRPFVWGAKLIGKTDSAVHTVAEKAAEVTETVAPAAESLIPATPAKVEDVQALIAQVEEQVKNDHLKRAEMYDSVLSYVAQGDLDSVETILGFLGYDLGGEDNRPVDRKGRLLKKDGCPAETTFQARKRNTAEKAARELYVAKRSLAG